MYTNRLKSYTKGLPCMYTNRLKSYQRAATFVCFGKFTAYLHTFGKTTAYFNVKEYWCQLKKLNQNIPHQQKQTTGGERTKEPARVRTFGQTQVARAGERPKERKNPQKGPNFPDKTQVAATHRSSFVRCFGQCRRTFVVQWKKAEPCRTKSAAAVRWRYVNLPALKGCCAKNRVQEV